MKIQFATAISVVFLLASSLNALAEISCLSGKPGNDNLITQLRFAKAKSPVTEIIYKQYELDTKTATQSAPCAACKIPLAERPKEIAELNKQLNGIPDAPKMLFNSECLKASVTFKAGASEVSCPEGKKSSSANLCVSDEVMNYQNAVISSFANCAKKSGLTTFSPASLYAMYSNESTFKPQYASPGGVGMSQVTGIFVDDIHQKWRGYKFLDKIAKSDLKECEAAKIIANKDTQSKPNLKNTCSFIQSGEGLERNVLYGLIGMATAWERDIEPALKPYIILNQDNPLLDQIKNAALINAYGSGGRAAARAIIARLGTKSPEDFLERLSKPMPTMKKDKKGNSINLNSYSLKIKKRQDEIGKKLPEPLRSAHAKNGAQACIK